MKEFGGIACRVNLVEILFVQRYDGAFYHIHFAQTFCFYVGFDCLRHPSHKHIQAEIAHKASVAVIAHRLSAVIQFFQKRNGNIVVQRPFELLVVQRKQAQLMFLAWN